VRACQDGPACVRMSVLPVRLTEREKSMLMYVFNINTRTHTNHPPALPPFPQQHFTSLRVTQGGKLADYVKGQVMVYVVIFIEYHVWGMHALKYRRCILMCDILQICSVMVTV
jgi:hypothetical protein